MSATITTMENGGYLIEAQPKTQPTECPWRHPETCKACEEKPCQNNRDNEAKQ